MASYYGQYGIRINSIISGGVEGHVAGSNKNNQVSLRIIIQKRLF